MAYRKTTITRRVYRKKRKTAYRKKRSTRSRRSKTTMRNSNPGQLIAPRYITKLKYADRLITGSSGTGISSNYAINLNSIFDPDRTGTGHQPLGHDQLELLYNRYRVFAVSWRVEFPPVGAAGSAATFFVAPKNDAIGMNLLGPGAVKETPHTLTKISRVDEPVVFTGRVSLPKLTGQTSQQYKAGLEYQASFGTSPNELQTLQIGAIPFSASSVQYSFDISLMYHVECFDPKTLAQS